MTYKLKNTFSLLSLGTILGATALLTGCGGGGSSSPRPTAVPSPFDASYIGNFTPADAIPTDGKAPIGVLNITGGKATFQTTFFLQPSVVSAVQKAIDDGLNNAGFGSAIPDNQVPQSIAFAGSGQLDGNAKVVLISKKSVDVCGTATLTISPNFASNVGFPAGSGSGSYEITFPDSLTIKVRGRTGTVNGTCNNLPLRKGTVVYTR